MNRLILGLALAAGPAMTAATAQVAGPPGTTPRRPISVPGEISKSAPVNGVVVLYGNERCPTDPAGNEVVVCVRRSAQEQFRVPKELREFQITPQNESWAVKAQGTIDAGVGANSIGSCSTVGAGGATGCFAQRVRESKRENAERAEAQSRVP